MAYVKAQLEVLQQIAATGLPLVGGRISAYVWDTVTPQAMYTSSSGAGSAVYFTLNSLGQPQSAGGTAVDIFLDDTKVYKFIITDDDAIQVGPVIGPVYPAGDGNGITFTSMEALRLSSADFDYIETTSFYEGGTTGGAKLYRDGTGTPTGSGAAVIAAALAAGTFCNAAGVCYKLMPGQGINHYMFGVIGDGTPGDEVFFNLAASFVSVILGGGELLTEAGEFKAAGSGLFNILAGVKVRGVGAASVFVSESGGQSANHALVYLKDGAQISDCRISGSDYHKQSGGADYISYHKIGITTQGATTANGCKVLRVGFQKVGFSHVYVHSAHSGVEIDGCYTYGQQVGDYADVDANGLVTSWNATQDAGRLLAGTQVNCLTNFYNSGSATFAVSITNGVHFNINDAFVGVNSGSHSHTINGNIFIKNVAGYYGGWGLDMNQGNGNTATGNYLEGGSAGCDLFACTNNTITGNTFKCDVGVLGTGTTTTLNKFSGNTIILTNLISGVAVKTGFDLHGVANNDFTNNLVDGNSIVGSKGAYLRTSGSGCFGNDFSDCYFSGLDEGITSDNSANDSNYADNAKFRSVTTPYPRRILSNQLTHIRGLSGTSTVANNVGGQVTISAGATSAAVTFTNTEPDTSYRLMFSIRSATAAPAAGAYIPLPATSRTTGGFTMNVSAAPGGAESVTYEWLLFRA